MTEEQKTVKIFGVPKDEQGRETIMELMRKLWDKDNPNRRLIELMPTLTDDQKDKAIIWLFNRLFFPIFDKDEQKSVYAEFEEYIKGYGDINAKKNEVVKEENVSIELTPTELEWVTDSVCDKYNSAMMRIKYLKSQGMLANLEEKDLQSARENIDTLHNLLMRLAEYQNHQLA